RTRSRGSGPRSTSHSPCCLGGHWSLKTNCCPDAPNRPALGRPVPQARPKRPRAGEARRTRNGARSRRQPTSFLATACCRTTVRGWLWSTGLSSARAGRELGVGRLLTAEPSDAVADADNPQWASAPPASGVSCQRVSGFGSLSTGTSRLHLSARRRRGWAWGCCRPTRPACAGRARGIPGGRLLRDHPGGSRWLGCEPTGPERHGGRAPGRKVRSAGRKVGGHPAARDLISPTDARTVPDLVRPEGVAARYAGPTAGRAAC
ncbi:hypothetical protein SAMN04488085_104403, partial [Geodermatophilus ruber]